MLRKPISFEDFDGNPQTEVYYFNMNTAEVIGLSFVGEETGLDKLLNSVVAEQDVQKILEMFTEVVSKAYGVRSEDGKRFHKSPELFEAFKETPAYDTLIIEMITNPAAAAEFFEGILPKAIQERAAAQSENVVQLPPGDDGQSNDETPWLTEDRDPTKMELRKMSKAQLQQAVAAKQRRQRATESEDAETAALLSAFDE